MATREERGCQHGGTREDRLLQALPRRSSASRVPLGPPTPGQVGEGGYCQQHDEEADQGEWEHVSSGVPLLGLVATGQVP